MERLFCLGFALYFSSEEILYLEGGAGIHKRDKQFPLSNLEFEELPVLRLYRIAVNSIAFLLLLHKPTLFQGCSEWQ